MIPVLIQNPRPQATHDDEPGRPDRAADIGDFGSLLAQIDALAGGAHAVARGSMPAEPRRETMAREAAAPAPKGEETPSPSAGPAEAHAAERHHALLGFMRSFLHLTAHAEAAQSSPQRPVIAAAAGALAREAALSVGDAQPDSRADNDAAAPDAPPADGAPAELSVCAAPQALLAELIARDPGPAPQNGPQDGPQNDMPATPPPAGLPAAAEAESPSGGLPGATVILCETHFAPVLEAAAPEIHAARPIAPPAPSSRTEPADETPTAKDDRKDMRQVPPAHAARQDMPSGTARRAEAPGRSAAPADTASAEPAPTGPSLAMAGLPGVAPSAPAVQLADAIAEAVRVGGGGDSAAAGSGQVPATRGPVRVLEIQLHPVELGLVTVRLRTGRNGLEVQIHAAREETARLIEHDRARLLDTLAEQGTGPVDLLIGGPGHAAALTGHDAATRTPDTRPGDTAQPETPAGDDPDPDSRRKRQDHEKASRSAADPDADAGEPR